jgi:hypothetical protein
MGNDSEVVAMSLNDVTVAITSFCRWGYLAECLKRVGERLPQCQVIVADDSFNDKCATVAGPGCIRLTPDSGLTVKRNAIVKAAKTPYVLMFCDDFDANTEGYPEMLTGAVDLLDMHPEIDLVGGRVGGNPYESNLVHDTKENVIREIRLVPNGSPYQRCDLVVNHFVARTSTLLEVPWDEDVRPIGGEHGQFFWHMKKAGRVTVWLPGWNVGTLYITDPNAQDPRYSQFRKRAFAAGHTIMLRKEGWKDWVGA